MFNLDFTFFELNENMNQYIIKKDTIPYYDLLKGDSKSSSYDEFRRCLRSHQVAFTSFNYSNDPKIRGTLSIATTIRKYVFHSC